MKAANDCKSGQEAEENVTIFTIGGRGVRDCAPDASLLARWVLPVPVVITAPGADFVGPVGGPHDKETACKN